MMERREFAAPDASIAVCALAMTGIDEALCNGTPLHSEVVVVVERSHLVNTPRKGTVVDDCSGLVSHIRCVSSVVYVSLLTATEAHETYDVVIARGNGVVAHGDAGLRCCLSEDSGVVANGEVTVQGYDAGNVEDDDFSCRAFNGAA